MKQLILILALTGIGFSSCTSVKFENSQPKDTEELNAFPPSLVGVYFDGEKDTLTLTNNSFKYGNEKSFFHLNGTLASGESTLKISNDYLVLSLKDKGTWEVIVGKFSGKDLIAFYIDIDKEREKTIKQLKEIVTVKEIKNDNGTIDYYLINPTKNEFEKLIQKNLFAKKVVFKRIK